MNAISPSFFKDLYLSTCIVRRLLNLNSIYNFLKLTKLIVTFVVFFKDKRIIIVKVITSTTLQPRGRNIIIETRFLKKNFFSTLTHMENELNKRNMMSMKLFTSGLRASVSDPSRGPIWP